MWEEVGELTIECIAEGCRTLAMIWSSAWAESGADAPAAQQIDRDKLRELYMDPTFVPSMFLPPFIDAGIW
jgi:hypothetical protein